MNVPIIMRLPQALGLFSGESKKNKHKQNLQQLTKKRYQEIVSQLLKFSIKDPDIKFSEATTTDLNLLEKLDLPYQVAQFFIYFNLNKQVKVERVILYPFSELYKKNMDTEIGQLIYSQGYRIIAGTSGTDVYAIYNKNMDISGQSPVYLITGNALNKNNLESIKESTYLIATSFISFLSGL